MKDFKIHILYSITLFSALLIILSFPLTSSAQYSSGKTNVPFVRQDDVDDEQDLFDESFDYRTMFTDLDSEGEWIEITKEQLEQQSTPRDGSSQGYSSTNTPQGHKFWMWRPHVRHHYHNWNPYRYGRWYYTDYYDDWYWDSDYGWAWGPYHYGRWVYTWDYGWVWIPGRYWAPSWVFWMWYDDYDYIGWYPRGPRYYYGYNENNYYYNQPKDRWVVVEKEKIGNKIDDRVVITPKKNDDFNQRIKKSGPPVSILEKNGARIEKKEINFTGAREKKIIDDNSITVFRPDMKDKTGMKIKNTDIRTDDTKVEKNNEGSRNTGKDINADTQNDTQKKIKNENPKEDIKNDTKENQREKPVEKVKENTGEKKKEVKTPPPTQKPKEMPKTEKPKIEKPKIEKPRNEAPKERPKDTQRSKDTGRSKETVKSRDSGRSQDSGRNSNPGSRNGSNNRGSNNTGKKSK